VEVKKMQKKLLIGLLLPFLVLLFFTGAACTKKVMNSGTEIGPEETPAVATLQSEPAATENAPPEPSRNEAIAPQPAAESPSPKEEDTTQRFEEGRRKAFLSELVLFEFDSSALTATAQEFLKRKAEWLNEHPDVAVTIEGHCDERGSTAYNLALGERRAQAARSMLMDLGVSPERLETVSYGEERPFIEGHYEGAWSRNRRAHFVLQ